MTSKTITFNKLQNFLQELGFLELPTTGSHKVFKHQSSGALIVLPDYPQAAYVETIHLVAIHRILLEYQLVKETELSAWASTSIDPSERLAV